MNSSGGDKTFRTLLEILLQVVVHQDEQTFNQTSNYLKSHRHSACALSAFLMSVTSGTIMSFRGDLFGKTVSADYLGRNDLLETYKC